MSKKPSSRRPSPRPRSTAASTGGTAVADAAGLQSGGPSFSSPDGPAPRAVVTFLADWQEHRDADPTAGGKLVLAYDPLRLAPHDDAKPAVVGYAHFLPGGQLRTVALRDSADGAASAQLAAGDIAVPDDAQAVELWFEGTAGNGPRWDSRFGQNYRFAIAPPVTQRSAASPVTSTSPAADAPAQPAQASTTVALRPGARRAPAAVRVLADGAVKQNAFTSRPGYPNAGSNLQTRLRVTAQVRDADDATKVYVDVHVLDAESGLLHAETLPLRRERGPDDVGPRFLLDTPLDHPLYQGTIATPGSVSPRPDARTIEYRLYAEIDGRLRTDGLVHRCELKPDSGSGYESTEDGA
jgi:hypothetical protein